jgi:hypothetical protein
MLFEEGIMNIRTLTEIEDLEVFRTLTAKYIDVLFPMEYLQQSKVVVCCLPTGEFCGGYMVVPQGDSPLRVLDSIPDDEFPKIKTDLSNVAEVTGLWLDSKKADTTFCSIIFWLKLFVDLSFSKYDGYVYAYNVKKKDIKRAYAPLGPVSLFEGATKQLDGMDEPELEAVEYLGRKNVRSAPFKQFPFLFRRFKVAFKRVSRRKFFFLRPIRLSFVALFKIFS